MGRPLGDTEQDLFTPLRPAKGTKLVAAALVGPVAWVIAWLVAAWLIYTSDTIGFGLLGTIGSFLFALPVLGPASKAATPPPTTSTPAAMVKTVARRGP